MRIIVISIALIVVLGMGYIGYHCLFLSSPFSQKYVPPVLPDSTKNEKSLSEIEKEKHSVREAGADMRARTEIKSAVEHYMSLQQQVPRQAASTIKILIGAMKKGRLPSVFLSEPIKAEKGQRKYERLSLNTEQIINSNDFERNIKQVNCRDIKGSGGGYANILIGDILDNVFVCTQSPKERAEDQLFLGGPGNDTIKDSLGNTIVNGGTGDDEVIAGKGRKIFVFEKGWGKDKIKGDCRNAIVANRELPTNDPLNKYWHHKFFNFVVFGPQVREQDMEWVGLTYRDKITGDSITFDNKCYNFVFYDQ